MLYFDTAATSPVHPEVLQSMWPYLSGDFGNPSSHHAVGESAARGLAAARSQVAAALGCRASEVTFTSGGTESNNLAIKGIALGAPKGRHLVVSAIEHPSVLETCSFLARLHGFEVTMVAVDADGLVDPADVEAALRPDTTLVSIMYANNEVGTVQPIAEIAAITASARVPFHTDAVQAAGWLPLDITELRVDALTLAGHKMGAPKGVGVLFARGRLTLEPLVHGGGQQRGRRSGTENVAGAVAFATALRLAEQQRTTLSTGIAALRDEFITSILQQIPGAVLTGHAQRRLGGSASFLFEGTSGEAVLLELERRGVTCSSGSACAAGSDEPSPVLRAMGVPSALAQTAVRFSFAADTSREQLDEAAAAVLAAVAAVQQISVRTVSTQ